MSRLLALLVLIASPSAFAETPLGRIGGTVGFQQTDRSAWVFGPSLEVRVYQDISIRGDAQLELGDFDDPFGESNIRGGDGPHVNHVLFGPVWRPAKYARYQLGVGAGFGVLVMHSVFADDHVPGAGHPAGHEFTKRPAAGLFVQAGRRLGPISLALQLRLDMSTSVEMGGPGGVDVPTTSGRINLAFEFPISVR